MANTLNMAAAVIVGVAVALVVSGLVWSYGQDSISDQLTESWQQSASQATYQNQRVQEALEEAKIDLQVSGFEQTGSFEDLKTTASWAEGFLTEWSVPTQEMPSSPDFVKEQIDDAETYITAGQIITDAVNQSRENVRQEWAALALAASDGSEAMP
jgi:hypothetical protein